MIAKKNLMLLFLVILLIYIEACSSSTEPEKKEESGTTANIDSIDENYKNHEDNDDYNWDNSTVIPIELKENSFIANTSGVLIDGSTITIISAGTYNFIGSLTDGQIVVNTQDEALVRLILNGVNINCSSNAPIYIKSAKKVVIVLADNSENVITDGKTYTLENTVVDEPNAAIYSKSDLTIFGNGSLKVTGNYNDGISSTDGLIIKSGNINVDAADDGIRGKDYLIIKDGNITVNSKGDGLISDNTEDATRGYISIESGIFNLTTASDAIDAATDVIIYNGIISITSGGGSGKTVSSDASAKAIKGIVSVVVYEGNISINSADDAVHSNGFVRIDNGTLNISSGDDGIHGDVAIKINNGNVKITKSVEGIESAIITINDGYVSIVSNDDGFNATKGGGGEQNDGSFLYLHGGNVCVNSSKGDGLDSNGNIVMTAGTVIVHGPPSSPEVGTDFNGTFNISGGFLILTGPNSGQMIEATSTSSEQNAVKVTINSQLSSSTLFHIQDGASNNLVTFQPLRNCYYIVFSSPELKSGSDYYIFTGGTSTGTNTNGLYIGGVYSGGTQKKSFTVSNKVTSINF